jgi:hypothetical protein
LESGFDCLIYKRYDRKCCRWVRESRESFLAQEGSMPTLFYAHGNSLNHKNAMKSCWQVYCKMRCCPGPKRLVFWSWPAERVYKTQGLRVCEMIEKNLRIKYVYAEYQGYYLAQLVEQMSLSQRAMLSGHSYGGIIVSAATHYLGGGSLRDLALAGGSATMRPNLRTAVISGAFDHDMLNPGNRYGQTFVAAEKVLVTRNIKDRTLKKWPKTSWRCKRAIGVLGVNACCLGEYRSKLCQLTMTSDVGRSHYLKPHLQSVRFVASLCCLSFPPCCESVGSQVPVEVHAAANNDLPLEAQPAGFLQDDWGVEPAAYSLDNELQDLSFLGILDCQPEDETPCWELGSLTDTTRFDGSSLDALVIGSSIWQPQLVPEAQPAKPARQPQPIVETPRIQVQAGGGYLDQLGLCLALALVGHCYVLFSKRLFAS